MSKISSKLKTLTHVTSLAEADHFLRESLKSYGSENFTYNYYPNNYQYSRTCLHSICTQETVGWSRHYVQNKYEQIDPIFIKLKNSLLPIGWSITEEINHYQKNQRSVLEAAYDFGFQGGFGIPIHTPNNGYANLVIQEVSVLNKIKEKPNMYNELQLLAYHYQARVNQFIREQRSTPFTILTAREIECLRLTANHKSAKSIALILQITPRTVSFHLENAMHKLNVKTKYEAVEIAKSLGQI